MSRSVLITTTLFLSMLVAACNNNKPKPTSNDITKQTVQVNGKKDSISNNADKNYGNATVSEPCVKCLIKAIQATQEYEVSILGNSAPKLIYNVNWIRGEGVGDTSNNKGATNALRVDLVQKGINNKNVASFKYDNSTAKLYFIKTASNNELIEANTDKILLKKIRNACYWGVASGK